MKGMLVFVLRSTNDCTNDGVTATFDQFVMTGDGVAGVFEPSDKSPELELRWRGDYPYCVPVGEGIGAGCVGPMAGGNFVYSSDSRFRRLTPQPISVHDRFETAEQQRMS